MLSIRQLLTNSERVALTLNGHKYNLPKTVIDTCFITAGVTGFSDVHEYEVEGLDEAKEVDSFYNELIDYLSGSCKKISAPLSIFIDRYLVDRKKLFEWVLTYYTKKLEEMTVNPLTKKKRKIIPDISSFVRDFYDENFMEEYCGDVFVNILRIKFPELYERMARIYPEKTPHNTELSFGDGNYKSKICMMTLRELSRDVEMFMPEYIKELFARYDVTVVHAIPNLESYNYNDTIVRTDIDSISDCSDYSSDGEE